MARGRAAGGGSPGLLAAQALEFGGQRRPAEVVRRQHEIGIDGPVRESYLVDRFQTDAAAEWRTEIGWPIFQARAR